MIIEKKDRGYEINNDYLYIVITLLLTSFVFFISVTFEYEIYNIFSAVNFLTWHILFEFTSVIFAFIIFNNCYHSYKHTKRIRLLVVSTTFFIVGCIDFLHVISYKGMPYTFAASSVKMATAYWIIARLIMATGLFAASIIPFFKKSKVNEKLILFFSILVVFIFFHIVTHKLDSLPPLFIEGKGLTKLKIHLEFVVMFLQIAAIINFVKSYRKTVDKYLIILSSSLVLLTFSEALFTLYKSVYDTFNLLGHMYKTAGFYLVYYSIFKYNIDKPYIRLKEMQERMKLYADNLEKIVDIKTNKFREADKKLVRELDYAKVIQQSLLPPSEMSFGNVVFKAEYMPCEKLSGDFYDIYEIDKENVGMYILDVTGHGVPAALLTMFSINSIKSNERLIKRYRGLKPHKNLKNFYEEFNRLHFPEEMHIVTFFATYNMKSRILTYCSAGMNCHPIIIRRTGEYEFLDKSIGFPICQFGDFFTPEYKSASIELSIGDKVIFYTDGLIEKQKNSRLNEKELINILLGNSNNNIERLNRDIIECLESSPKGFEDDITYFIMEVV